MALLAEQKRKVKFGLDPRNTNWSNDESKLGQKLMEKMGWTKGKGLGANEDGMTDHIKASYKSDSRGLGCTLKEADAWVAHQDDFNDLLKTLNSENSTEPAETKSDVKTDSKRFYGRFARGRTATLRSTEDLDCIFGKRKTKTDDVDKESNVHKKMSVDVDNEEISHGLMTTTSECSVQEYFARKMAERKLAAERNEGLGTVYDSFGSVGQQGSEVKKEEDRPQFGVPQFGAVGFSYDDKPAINGEAEHSKDSEISGQSRGWYGGFIANSSSGDGCEVESSKSKKKKKKAKKEEETSDSVDNISSCDKVSKKKKKRKSSEDDNLITLEEPKKKKRKEKISNDVNNDEAGDDSETTEDNTLKIKKKKKKRKNIEKVNSDEGNEIGKDLNEEDIVKKKKKKKKSRDTDSVEIAHIEESNEVNVKEKVNSDENTEIGKDTSEEVKKKKKKKKSRDADNIEIAQAEESKVESTDDTINKICDAEVHEEEKEENIEDNKNGKKKNKRKQKKKSKKDPQALALEKAFRGSNISEIDGYGIVKETEKETKKETKKQKKKGKKHR